MKDKKILQKAVSFFCVQNRKLIEVKNHVGKNSNIRERSMMSLVEHETYEEKIMEWIADRFILNEIEIEDYPFFLMEN